MRPLPAGVAALLALTLLAAGCPPTSERPPAPGATRPPPAPPPIEAFFNPPVITDVSFFPARDRVLFSAADPTGTNVWRVGLDGQADRLTDCGADACRAVAALAGGRVLFSRGTDEGDVRLMLLEPGRPAVELPGQDGTAEQFIGRSPDGASFYTGGNGRDEAVFDLYQWDAAGMKPRRVFKNDHAAPWFMGPVSDDGRLLALSRSRGADGDELRVRDLGTGSELKISLAPRDLVEPKFYVGDHLFFIAYGNAEHRGLWRAGQDGKPVPVLVKDGVGIRSAQLSSDGKWVVTLRGNGFDVDHVLFGDARTLRFDLGQELNHATWVEFNPRGNGIVSLAGGETEPDTLVFKLPGGPRRTLYGGGLKIAPAQLCTGNVANGLIARDGLPLSGMLYLPPVSGPSPAVIWLHGGPGGEARREYAPGIQYLVSRGYVVLALNYRGSSGYGRAFLDADNRRHGGAVVDDVIDAAEWLAARPEVDPTKIAVVGRSYGGYLALAALARAPEKFAAGVDLFGPSNWVAALSSLPPSARVFRPSLFAEIGDPVADRDELLAISPVSLAEKLRGPLLIIQGRSDDRVATEDTTELVRRIRSHGASVEYVYFLTEGHGFSHVQNEMRCWDRVREFLDLHLRGIKPPPAAAPRPTVFAQ